MYLSIVRDVVEYAVVSNVTSATQLHRLFYRRYRLEYQGLHSHLVIQAIKQASEIAKSFVERKKKGLGEQALPGG
jgi:hypothetical protein